VSSDVGADVRDQVVDACRILAVGGHEHLFLGHVSARASGQDRFWVKSTGLGLGEVGHEDLVLVDLDGRRREGEGPLHGELPIHTEIHRRRAEVTCVVHTHPFHVAAFSASNAEFAMVSQESTWFTEGIARFESALRIETIELGQRLAETLGDRSAAILRNHGLVVAASSVERAVVLAIALEQSLRVQVAAALFGDVVAIPESEAARIRASLDPPDGSRVRATYRYLRRRAGRSEPTG